MGKFARNHWYVAAWTSELGEGRPVARRLLGEPVVLFRHAHRSVAALTDRCPHRLVPLSPGNLRKRPHPALERYGLVWRWMGEPAQADPATVPRVEKYREPACSRG